MTEHIIGTHISDLIQIYNGRISIQGSVNFNTVSLISTSDANESKRPIIINNLSFDLPHLKEQYWMKTLDQVI